MAIAFGGVSGASAASATSLTFSHTTTGTLRVLFVGIWVVSTSDVVTSVTYNGVALTRVRAQQSASDSRYQYIYMLENPASGGNNVIVFTSSSVNIFAIAAHYTGAKQTDQPDNSGSHSSGVASTTWSDTITPVADNCWMVALVRPDSGRSDTAASSGTTMRLLQSSSIAWFDSNAAITPIAAKTMTYSATTTRWTSIYATLAPPSPFRPYAILF